MPTRVLYVQTDTPEEAETVGQVMRDLIGMAGGNGRESGVRSQESGDGRLGVSGAVLAALPEAADRVEAVIAAEPVAPVRKRQARAGGRASKAMARPRRQKAAALVGRATKRTSRAARAGVGPGFVCRNCAEKFESAAGLGSHRKAAHPEAFAEDLAAKEAGKGFACADCSFRGESEWAVRLHRAKMHGAASAARRAKQFRGLAEQAAEGNPPATTMGTALSPHYSVLPAAPADLVRGEADDDPFSDGGE